MTEYQELTKIKQSLLSKIDQHSSSEKLSVMVQIEAHDSGFDTVVLLFDSEGLLLLDETYTTGDTSVDKATTKANELHACVSVWLTDKNVNVNEDINEVSL